MEERVEKLEALVVLLTKTVMTLAEGDEGSWWVSKGLAEPSLKEVTEAEAKLGVFPNGW